METPTDPHKHHKHHHHHHHYPPPITDPDWLADLLEWLFGLPDNDDKKKARALLTQHLTIKATPKASLLEPLLPETQTTWLKRFTEQFIAAPMVTSAKEPITLPATAIIPPRNDLFVEAVTICVNYGDFLAWTLPFNRNQFSNMVVVTSPEDSATQRLCTHYHVQCVQTDVFTANGRKFNKGAAINEGLKRLSRHGWVVQLDADILVPPRTKEFLGRALLDPTAIYGIDRFDVNNFADFIRHVTDPELQLVADTYIVDHTVLGRGARLMNEDGYVPIGFFQAWNPKGSAVYQYVTDPDPRRDGSEHGDVTFARKWPRVKRNFIPEMTVYHLQSDVNSCNWAGRTSKSFGLEEVKSAS